MQLQIARIWQREMGILRGERDNLGNTPMVDKVIDSSDAVVMKRFLWNASMSTLSEEWRSHRLLKP